MSYLFATKQFALIITEFLFCFWLIARKQFCIFFRPDLVETLFMARGQLLSLILAWQYQKVADPCFRWYFVWHKLQISPSKESKQQNLVPSLCSVADLENFGGGG